MNREKLIELEERIDRMERDICDIAEVLTDNVIAHRKVAATLSDTIKHVNAIAQNQFRLSVATGGNCGHTKNDTVH